jgi:hypothetical protein
MSGSPTLPNESRTARDVPAHLRRHSRAQGFHDPVAPTPVDGDAAGHVVLQAVRVELPEAPLDDHHGSASQVAGEIEDEDEDQDQGRGRPADGAIAGMTPSTTSEGEDQEDDEEDGEHVFSSRYGLHVRAVSPPVRVHPSMGGYHDEWKRAMAPESDRGANVPSPGTYAVALPSCSFSAI